MRTTARRLCAVAAALAFGAWVPAAVADSGVHIDPNSPAGKEYAIPFQSARQAGGGGGSPVATADAVAQAAPFGAGIRRASRATAGGSGRARRASGRGQAAIGTTIGGGSEAYVPLIRSRASVPAPRFDAPRSSDWGGAVLPAGLVLIAGGGVGVALRARRVGRRPAG